MTQKIIVLDNETMLKINKMFFQKTSTGPFVFDKICTEDAYDLFMSILKEVSANADVS